MGVRAVVPVEWEATAVLLGDLLVVLGDASSMGDLHDCDQMGCGSVHGHVIARHHQPKECGWRSDDGVWRSDCGVLYEFNDGGPVENGHEFCHRCGKPLRVGMAP